MQIEWK